MNAWPVIFSNGASLSTSNPKFGASALALSGADQLQKYAVTVPITQGTALDIFATNAWTIECFFLVQNRTGEQAPLVHYAGKQNVFVASDCVIVANLSADGATGSLNAYANRGSFPPLSVTGLMAPNTWHHMALVGSGGTVTLYLDGIAGNSGSWGPSNYTETAGSAIFIGSLWFLSDGTPPTLIDELRVSNVAIYTGAFTAPAAPFANPVQAPPVLNTQDPNLILDWSDDGGQSFGNRLTVPLGKVGERTSRAIFRRLGKSRDRVWRATLTDPVKRIFIGAGIDFTVGS